MCCIFLPVTESGYHQLSNSQLDHNWCTIQYNTFWYYILLTCITRNYVRNHWCTSLYTRIIQSKTLKHVEFFQVWGFLFIIYFIMNVINLMISFLLFWCFITMLLSRNYVFYVFVSIIVSKKVFVNDLTIYF